MLELKANLDSWLSLQPHQNPVLTKITISASQEEEMIDPSSNNAKYQ